jgi:hypothetical protein
MEKQDWKTNFKLKREILFDGGQYQEWLKGDFPIIAELPKTDGSLSSIKDKGILVGDNMRLYKRQLPLETMSYGMWGMGTPRKVRAGLSIAQGKKRGKIYFTTPVDIPILARTTDRDVIVMMSLTPMEVITLRSGIRKAKGKVAIAGLGMGWMARRVLERKSVTEVTVVEKSQGIADFFGKKLQEDYPGKVNIVVGDVYEQDYTGFDVVLVDIWNDYGDATYDRKFNELKLKSRFLKQTIWGWGESAF